MAQDVQGHLSHFNLKIDGAQASGELMDQIVECSVENSVHLPDVCTIQLHDSEFKLIDATTLDAGKKIEIFASNEDMTVPVKIFCGEVTAIEMEMAADAVPLLSVRAYDYAHRLQRGRSTRTFNQMTDTDIVNQVGREAGFTVHADSTSQVHDWIIQKNKTDWEFLQERSLKNGYRLYVNDEKQLYFCKVENDRIGPYSSTGDGSGNPDAPDKQDSEAGVIKVEWGKSLRSFRPRLGAARQVGEVIVRGWDPQTKRAIVGRAQQAQGVPQVGLDKSGGDTATGAFGAAKMVVTDRPVHSQQDADDLARSVCDEIGGEFLEADGVCFGVPTLRAGKTISIPNIGKRFSGKYHITSVTHTYTPHDGYSTHFVVSAKTAPTLLSLLSSDSPAHNSESNAGNGIVVGVVTDNSDPNNQGRVKVKYPWLSEDHTSYWARIASPMAGSGRGFQFLPEIDDEVLVAFEHGDPTRPYIIGALWNGTDSPPYETGKSVGGGKVVRRMIQTRVGHKLAFLESPDTQGFVVKTADEHVIELRDTDKLIRVKTKMGHLIEMNDAEGKILVKDMTGANSIEIDSTGRIAMVAVSQISLTSGGTISMMAAGGINITSGGALQATAGAVVALTSGAATTITATGPVALSSGAAVSLASSGALVATAGGAAAITSGGALALTAPTIPITGTLLVDGIPVP